MDGYALAAYGSPSAGSRVARANRPCRGLQAAVATRASGPGAYPRELREGPPTGCFALIFRLLASALFAQPTPPRQNAPRRTAPRHGPEDER